MRSSVFKSTEHWQCAPRWLRAAGTMPGMESQLDWDELKLVLAIARAGSLAGAARRLGLSHATIFRHLNALEKALGMSLFQRDRNRYAATAAGDALAATAAEVETRILDVEQRLTGQAVALSGTIRVTTTDTLLAGLLAPILAMFQDAYPEIVLEVSVSNTVFSLSRRDADIAIRPGHDPNERLVGRRIGQIEQAVYASATHPDDDPASPAQRWVGSGVGMDYPELDAWLRDQDVESRCWFMTNTLLATHAAVVAGVGIGVLPCYLGDADRRLRRLQDSSPALTTDLWLLIHPDVKRVAPFKAFNDFVFEAVRARLRKTDGSRATDEEKR